MKTRSVCDHPRGCDESRPYNVVPNPANDILHIQTATLISRIEVFNLAGQHIATHEANDNNIQLSTNTWTPGIYILKIQTAQGIVNRKVVVSR